MALLPIPTSRLAPLLGGNYAIWIAAALGLLLVLGFLALLGRAIGEFRATHQHARLRTATTARHTDGTRSRVAAEARGRMRELAVEFPSDKRMD
jgi:hypothetical protein